jgi:multidrug efflux pump subunit AcrA (membrane-fusion protein)
MVDNVVRTLKQKQFAAILTLLIACGLASAQPKSTASKNELTESPANLVKATQEDQARSAELVGIQENEVNKATAKLDELRQLVAEGLVAKSELKESEQSLATLRAQLETTRKQIVDSDHMIARIRAEQELTKAQVPFVSGKMTSKFTSPTLLRYNGTASWSIGNLGGIQSFFSASFGHPLPTSAVGQSATHDRLGYDHRNAVDVALHPDSAEGKALINYLENQGIPFLAFRAAVLGVATGPHIHIGSPSHRI